MSCFNIKSTKEILDKLELNLGKNSHVNNLWKTFSRAKCEDETNVRTCKRTD